MSIIERALGKRRGSGSGDRDAGRQALRAHRPRDLIVSVTDPSKERRVPSVSIELDMDGMRAAGVAPPTEASDRLHEQIRRIKWPLLEAAVGRASASESPIANVVMVTSSIAAEGKTYVSFNLALGIAREKDFSVLLVDADVAKRHLSSVLKVEDRPGITDAVADHSIDPESLVLGTAIPGLTFLPAGRRTSIAPELFGSQRMADIVASLGDADRQRIVLFDSSPLLATNESPVLAKLVDQILMVVRAESTQQPVVLEAIALLDKTKSIRCVLNQTHMSSLSEHYYGYGYYPHDRPRDP